MWRAILKIFLLIFLFEVAACHTISTVEVSSPDSRMTYANALAQKRGFIQEQVITPLFTLIVYRPVSITGDTLRVYIEGDGHSWTNSHSISDDPTPNNPIALRLALADTSNSSVYLGRPCQYQYKSNNFKSECLSRYWTNERFSEKIVNSLNIAIDQLKNRFHAKHIILVGYSGGGSLALLCAAKRQDVSGIVTIAGNVSVRAWAREMSLTPLEGSLDPIDYVENIKSIPQWHFVGSDDEVVPPNMIESYRNLFPNDAPIDITIIKNFQHQCCWENVWPNLVRKIQ